jgi:nitrosocyanin
MRKLLTALAAILACLLVYRPLHSQKAAAKAENAREFTLMNLEYEGTKIWLPSLIVAKKGDRVRIKLINNVPSGEHGFAIPEFSVVDKVFKGEPRTVEFTADKTGLFKMFCQIHPAHIGGQLLVLE